jgi:hypothetical protein
MEEHEYLIIYKELPSEIMKSTVRPSADLVAFFQAASDVLWEQKPFHRRRIVIEVRLLVERTDYVRLGNGQLIAVPNRTPHQVEQPEEVEEEETPASGFWAHAGKLIKEARKHSMYHLVVLLMTIFVIAPLSTGSHPH